MTATELLAVCAAKGILLQADGDYLDIDAPKGELTPDLLSELKANKSELVTLVTGGDTDTNTISPKESVFMSPATPNIDDLTSDERDFFGSRLSARRQADEPLSGIGWRALVDTRRQFGHWSPAPTPRQAQDGSPPPRPARPDPRILADRPALCPGCGSGRVLPELRCFTGGVCFACWTRDTNHPN